LGGMEEVTVVVGHGMIRRELIIRFLAVLGVFFWALAGWEGIVYYNVCKSAVTSLENSSAEVVAILRLREVFMMDSTTESEILEQLSLSYINGSARYM
jgi:hypothetical protein